MSGAADNTESDYRKCKRSCCTVADYMIFCGLHALGANYLYSMVCFGDAVDNPEFANASKTRHMSHDNLVFMAICIYAMLYLFLIYAWKQYSRHAVGVCLSCQMIAFVFIYACVTRMISDSCKHRPLLTCYGRTEEYDLNNDALNAAQDLLGIACGAVAAAQTVFIACSMIKNKRDRKFYFSESSLVEFSKSIVFYYCAALVLVAIPIIVMCAIACLCSGGNGDGGGCEPSPSDRIYWNGVANGRASESDDRSRQRQMPNARDDYEV